MSNGNQFDTPFALAVKGLGETVESVTEALRSKGIKGYRRMCSQCPVANYLKACGFTDITVSTFANRYSKSDDSDESIELPKGVQAWIHQFDDGQHQEFWQE
jgi:hypothetical protein